ncbi:MAG: O-antigen ligase family protein [Filimonas sp.]|nr:O-antigen ligase family protein [Filimonas sp.]
MQDIQLPITPPGKSKRLRQVFAILGSLLVSIGFAVYVAQAGLPGSFVALAAMIGLPVLYATLAYPQFGVVTVLIFAYLLFAIIRMDLPFPAGTLMDGFQIILILSFFIAQRNKPNWRDLKGPVSMMILVWVGYNIFEVVNPSAASKLSWVYTIRSVALVMLCYFVFLYSIRTKQLIRLILKIWLFLSVVAALYALKQEFIGFSSAEDAWLHSDPSIAELLFIDGHWRRFSIFSDPVAFSYNMVISTLLSVALITGPTKQWKKIVLAGCAFLFVWAMLYSGTRGAYVLLPVSLALLAVLKFNRKVLGFAIVAAFGIAIAVFIPTSNPTLYRFQTAFRPSEDASFNLRKANQKKIQPYILSHPFGGGLGATGAWGQRFAPHSLLADFPPDSGYVRVAVELGWVGLILFCMLVFLILRQGIINYFHIRDPELKTYCLAMLLIVFALNIGNYPQEAIVQYPSSMYFLLAAALIVITGQLDKSKE